MRRAPWHARFKKLLFIILPAILVLVVGLSIYFGVSLYRLVHPQPTPMTVSPSHYLLSAVDVTWASGDGTPVAGWWIPASPGAAGILLAPGYGMSRSDALSLASPLVANGFNLLIYEQRGCGPSAKGTSSLGLRETADMVAALDFLENQPGVDRSYIGIWGVDMGARSALKAATARPEVRAIVADSAFEKVTDFLAVKIHEELRWNSAFLSFGLRQAFRLYFLESRASMNEGIPLGALADRSILFIQGENRLDMARLTASIYERVQPQKEMILVPVAKSRVMSEEEMAAYNRPVTNFFIVNLPKAKPAR